MKGYKKDKIIFSNGDTRVAHVEINSPSYIREKAKAVGRLGNKETCYDNGVFSGGDEALIGVVNERAISIIVLSEMDRIWKGDWTDLIPNKDYTNELTRVENLRGCTFYWVHYKYRCSRLLNEMPDQARILLGGVEKENFPLLGDFSDKGRHFFERYCAKTVTLGWTPQLPFF